MELRELFQNREWEIEYSHDPKISIYQRYCERLKLLDKPFAYLDKNEQTNYLKSVYHETSPFIKPLDFNKKELAKF